MSKSVDKAIRKIAATLPEVREPKSVPKRMSGYEFILHFKKHTDANGKPIDRNAFYNVRVMEHVPVKMDKYLKELYVSGGWQKVYAFVEVAKLKGAQLAMQMK